MSKRKEAKGVTVKERAADVAGYAAAVADACEFARQGPRVAAVALYADERYLALCGFIDRDTDDIKQIALITPDGRVWRQDR